LQRRERDRGCRGDRLVLALGINAVDVGDAWPDLLEVLRPRGRYAVSGAIAGAHVALDLRTLYLKDLTFIGCTVLDEGVFASLVHRIETGEVRPLVAHVFPLREIAAAQAAFVEKAHVGKIVLKISDDE